MQFISEVPATGLPGKSDYDIAQYMLLESILKQDQDIENRASLGSMVPIRLFQLLRLVALGSNLDDLLGQGAPALVYQSGQSLGKILGKAVHQKTGNDLDAYVGEIGSVCKQLSIGILLPTRVKADKGEFTLRVDECVSCAGIHGVSAPICHFEAGMVAGILRTFASVPLKARETKCNAVGDKSCLIEATLL